MSESPIFSQRLVVGPEHIDDLDHVSNVQYLNWILQAASAHSGAVGYDLEAYRRLGSVFIVRRHEIDYLDSALLGDELEISTWIESWKGASSKRAASIKRVADAKELCRSSTTWVFVSLANQRPRRIPSELVESFRVSELR